MSADIVSRWPVVVSVAVTDGDRDDEGYLTDAGAQRAFALARAAYFELCATVDPATLEVRGTAVARGAAVVGDRGVTIAVNVNEIYPDRFTMTARIRPRDHPGVAADAICSLSPGTEIPTAMRDEFIALAHAARHTH